MHMIEAIIRPNKLDAVKTALAKIGVLGVTAIECKGFGRQMGHTERYRGSRMDIGFVPKVLLKLCVKDSDREGALKAIQEAARSGEVGDGKIFVYPIVEVIRIRTGESGELGHLINPDNRNLITMDKPKVPPVINPNVDVGEQLHYIIGETGGVHAAMGGFKIKVYHMAAFPWDEVFKTLLYRDFKVYVTRHKADLFIEAAF